MRAAITAHSSHTQTPAMNQHLVACGKLDCPAGVEEGHREGAVPTPAVELPMGICMHAYGHMACS